MHSVRNAATALLLAVAAGGLVGCGGGGGVAPSKIDVKACLGTWIEVRENTGGENNPRMRVIKPLTDDLRRLTINEDGTYTMELLTPDGKPIEGAVIKGKWTNDERTMEFSATSNEFPSDLETLEPSLTSGVVDTPNGPRLIIEDYESQLVRFKRAE